MSEDTVESIDRQIKVAMVAVCYFILLCIGTQMFAVVNQRRYRSGFWLAIATFFLSVLLVWVNMVYTKTIEANKNADKTLTPEQEQQLMKETHYILCLPIVALLQLVFFTKRPFSLFGPAATVAATENGK